MGAVKQAQSALLGQRGVPRPDLVPDTHFGPLMGSEVCLQDQ